MINKYPFILVHGIILKDYKFFKAFTKIEKSLNDAGYIAITSTTDGFGSIENNAKQLKKQILEVLKKYNVDKVNLIAHSKGGLDAKYMIKELDMEDKVASLTTLCTPHKGSKIADLMLSLPKFIIKILEFFINKTYKLFKDENPDCYLVAMQLSTHTNIDEETIDFSDKIYCQSYSTTLHRGRDDFILGIPFKFSAHLEKDLSDGLVSKESSKFANYKGDCIEESISHGQIVGFTLSRKKKIKVIEFYLALCKNLMEMGF